MEIRELMSHGVITVGPSTPLKEAARRMVEAGVSGLPVTEDGRLVGVISEGDFVAAESQRGLPRPGIWQRLLRGEDVSLRSGTVGDAMTRDVITLAPDADHAQAARVMRRNRIKRIPVVEPGGSLVGILSRADILRAFTRPDAEIRSEIRERVMRKVLWVDPKLVDIQIDDGNVTMKGHLETRSDVELLEELVGRLDGVVSVNSHMTWETDNTELRMAAGPRPFGPNWY